MPLSLIISTNLLPFIGLLFLLVFAKLNPLFEKKQTQLFIIAILINIVLLIAISFDYIFANLNEENMWIGRRITSFLNFAACPAVPLLLLEIFEQKERKSKRRFFLYLPFLFNLILCFSSIFVNTVFFITEENYYDRGPLFFVPFAIAIFYIILLITKPVNQHVKSKRVERIFLIFIILLLVFCMVLEIQFRYHFLSWDCTVFALILYYLLLTIHCFIVDPLTGAYNRLMYTRALSNMEHSSAGIIALIDINDFKLINDLQGHDAGDLCLIHFADLFSLRFSGMATLYRIGGDEFVLIAKHTDYAAFEEALKKISGELKQQDISFAYGISEYHPQENIHETLKNIDQIMYLNKNKMKTL